MKIKDLFKKTDLPEKSRESKQFIQFESLLEALKNHELPANAIETINTKTNNLNTSQESGKKLAKLIKTSISQIISFLEKDHKIVTKNHYRNLWLAIGMGAFGVPLGVALGAVLDNMGLIGIGLPIGLAVGIAIGTSMDKKAAIEGRQLDFEVTI